MDLLLACKSALGIVVGDGVEQERSCTCAQMFDAGSKQRLSEIGCMTTQVETRRRKSPL